MTKPLLVVQLSDPHIGASWPDAEPAAALATAIATVHRLRLDPDAVLVSGDLAHAGTDAEYEQAQALLATLTAPVHVVAGNHDDRDALHRHFGVPGAGGAPVQYAVGIGPLRLVVLDTTSPGTDAGRLDADRLAWLDAELALNPDTTTLIAMHHPPLWTGLPAMDRIGLARDDRLAMATIIERNPQVRRIVAGHMHRTIVADLAGCAVLAAPSTVIQARLDFSATEFQFAVEPPGFAVHALRDDELVSHVQPVV